MCWIAAWRGVYEPGEEILSCIYDIYIACTASFPSADALPPPCSSQHSPTRASVAAVAAVAAATTIQSVIFYRRCNWHGLMKIGFGKSNLFNPSQSTR